MRASVLQSKSGETEFALWVKHSQQLYFRMYYYNEYSLNKKKHTFEMKTTNNQTIYR